MKTLMLKILTITALLMARGSFAEDFNIQELMSIDSHMTASDYQEVAKFYDRNVSTLNEKPRQIQGHFVTYAKNKESGLIYHISWFSEGYIITQVNGDDRKAQQVYWKGELFDSQKSPLQDLGSEILYKYHWGMVEIYPKGCAITLN